MGVKSCCGLERYSYVGVFEQICDFSYFRAMVCERGPNFVFLLVVYVINFLLYLAVKFLKYASWKLLSLLWIV